MGGGKSALRRLRVGTWARQHRGGHGSDRQGGGKRTGRRAKWIEMSRGGRRGGCTDHSPPESLRVELAVELLPAAADANVEGAIWIARVLRTWVAKGGVWWRLEGPCPCENCAVRRRRSWTTDGLAR